MANLITKEQYDAVFGDVTYDEFIARMDNRITANEFKVAYNSVVVEFLQKEDEQIEGSKDGLFASVEKKILSQFQEGGFDNEQKAIALGQFYASTYNTLESQANATTVALLKTDIEADLMSSKLLTENANRSLVLSNIETDSANKSLILSKVSTEASNKLDVESQTSVRNAESAQNILNKAAEKLLIDEKKTTETKTQTLLTSQSSLVDREKTGFDDNLRIKKAEFLGQLANFAVNADSTSAADAITNFNTAVSAITT